MIYIAAATKPAVNPVTTSPVVLKNNMKTEDGGKAGDGGPSSDQLVPDSAAELVIFFVMVLCQSTPPVRLLMFL